MKDCRLSEIKEICIQNKIAALNERVHCATKCPFQGYCGRYFGYDIEPRDWEIDIDEDEGLQTE